jgi:trans-aconitate methyltransferase
MNGHSVQFDEFAENYEAALDQGISVSGETKDYFARARIRWLAARLDESKAPVNTIMDYGCGIGSATRFFAQTFPHAQLFGVDVSSQSLEVAKRANRGLDATFLPCNVYVPTAEIDVAFCNGVFHHIQPKERTEALQYIYRSLRRQGFFAFWENNPWNPGTRYVMSRTPFDHDAITVSPLQARRLVRTAGFEVVRTDFLFIFPKVLRPFRVLEPHLAPLPLGAQYLVLCRKP